MAASFGAAGIIASVKKVLGKKENEKENEIVTAIKRAILAQQDGNNHAAEQILHVALKIAQERLDMQAETYIFDCMANLAFKSGDLKKAETLFKETMSRMLAFGEEPNSNSIVEISLKLAKIYVMQQRHQLAEMGFKFCLDTQENKIKAGELDSDTYLLWAMAMDWYASYLVALSQLKNARVYYEKALDISTQVNGPNHEQTVVLLNDLGSVCSLQGKYDEAVVHLKKAVTVAAINNNEELPVYYCNLGAIYTYKGELKKAKDCCTKALRLSKYHKNQEAEEQAKKCLSEIEVKEQ